MAGMSCNIRGITCKFILCVGIVGTIAMVTVTCGFQSSCNATMLMFFLQDTV